MGPVSSTGKAPRLTIVVPTLDAGPGWAQCCSGLLANLVELRLSPSTVLVLDSSSNGDTAARSAEAGFRVQSIDPFYFDHGGTRQAAVEQETDAEFIVFLTHDAVLADPHAIERLLAAFSDPNTAAAYGRQLPRHNAGPIEAHAREFNYPVTSRVRNLEDRKRLGFRSIFASNAFSAFRRSALMQVGGFPLRAICSEETIVIARLHLAGWQSAYVADAQVYHSHSFTVAREFRRYFDIGVTHSRYPFLLEEFSNADGEGKRFVLSELNYLLRHAPVQLPSAWLRTMSKLIAYRIGRRESEFSLSLRRHLSANQAFWHAEERLAQTAPEKRAAAEVIHETSSLRPSR